MTRDSDKAPFISVPDVERFTTLAREVFAGGVLTNNGPKTQELAARLADYLGVEHLVLTSSGTLALQVAYRALGLTGEVVTSPFSWITTASSLCWTGLEPRFADVDPDTFNIDPREVEREIGVRTSAILGVHTFGNPCDIVALERIAERRGVRTVYDAAHAFGVRYQGRSVLSFGDASILSLHATKLFHTVEGGAVILRDAEAHRRARLIVNNGADEQGRVHEMGINGRMSELHAAAGLVLLDNADGVLRRRRALAEALREQLQRSSGVQLQRLNSAASVNHAYMPVVFPEHALREKAIDVLESAGFKSRRYFGTPLNTLPFIRNGRSMPLAESLSSRVLCLFLRPDASSDEVRSIGEIVSALCPRNEMPHASLRATS